MEMNVERFLSLKLSEVSQVYSGKRNCCRCGCGGKYTATSFMESPRSEVDNAKVLKSLEKAKRLVKAGHDVDFGDNYIDIETVPGRCLTIYIDEIKSV